MHHCSRVRAGWAERPGQTTQPVSPDQVLKKYLIRMSSSCLSNRVSFLSVSAAQSVYVAAPDIGVYSPPGGSSTTQLKAPLTLPVAEDDGQAGGVHSGQ